MTSLPKIPQAQEFKRTDDTVGQTDTRSTMSSSSPLATQYFQGTEAPPPPVPQSKEPLLRTPLASETPDQWASSTLDAVSIEQARVEVIPASNISTPGPAIPGAYPTTLPLPSKETVQQDAAIVKDAAGKALETAKDYIVAGGQMVYPYVNAAGQTVYASAPSVGQKASATAAPGAETTKDSVASGAGTTRDAVVGGASTAGETTTSGAAATRDTVVGGVSAAGQTVASGAATARDAVIGGAFAAGETAKSGAAATRDTVVGGVSAAGQTVASGAAATRDTVVGGASAAGQTATSGASSIGQQMYTMAEAAGDRVAPYLPAAVASYIPHHVESNTDHIQHSTAVTDPTGNPNNGLEALEGTSFAKLPEEAKVDSEIGLSKTTFPTGNPKAGLEALHGTSLAKLPEERNAGGATMSATTFPTGNPKAGLEALSGTGLAKLPEERRSDSTSQGTKPNPTAAIPFSGETQSKGFDASYLNPNLVMAPEPSVKPTALPPRNVPEGKRPDEDASTKALPGSLLAGVGSTGDRKPEEHRGSEKHRGTTDSKPLNEDYRRDQGDKHLETLREHDAAAKSDKKGITDTLVSSMKDKESRYHGNVEKGIGHEPTVSKSTGDGRKFEGAHKDTGANKPVNETARKHALGAPDSKFEKAEQGPPVPEKINTPAHRDDSNVAQSGHSPGDNLATVGFDKRSTDTYKDRAAGGSMDNASDTSSGKHKVGFMSKVKGEMKVIGGKMTGKEEKVEEGRKIMGKN